MDDQYPVHYLRTAFDILVDKGEDSFEKYCGAVNMPKEDRERVKNKFNCSFNINRLAKAIG